MANIIKHTIEMHPRRMHECISNDCDLKEFMHMCNICSGRFSKHNVIDGDGGIVCIYTEDGVCIDRVLFRLPKSYHTTTEVDSFGLLCVGDL